MAKKPWSALRSALLVATTGLSVLLASYAHAGQGASPEQLRQLFEVSRSADLVDKVLGMLEQQNAATWQNEPNPDKQAEMKTKHERVAAVIRENLNWTKLEPMAIEVYQRHYDDKEVQSEIAYLSTPAGKVWLDKVAPLMADLLPRTVAYMETRFDEIQKRILANKPAPTRRPVKPKLPTDTKGKTAYALVSELSVLSSKPQFDARMANLENDMLSSVAAAAGGVDDETRTMIKKIAKELKREVTFEELKPIMADSFASQLSEGEMKLLLADVQRPERKNQIRQRTQTETDLNTKLNEHLRTNVLPLLMKAALPEAEPADVTPSDNPPMAKPAT
ncbi:DUF2059 domain-containing protein [Chitinivorax sp. B]|uniref:DUF2059 domain-containing protein n=1 Tax=Chitinivorax sp. B TaxID=2502235 RepID=UPI0010F924B9|nr:DUF2059 domain-containing protein [Chitinivorax sp. B]